jgi:TonB-dependent receptor
MCAASQIAHAQDFWLGISTALQSLKGDRIMRKCVYSFLAILFPSGALWLPSIGAQEAKGSIAGTVKDPSNSALTGALVELQPGGRRAVSDDQGQYRITGLPPGEYTLTASYLGFSPFTKSVKVDAGQVANVDAVLTVASRNDQLIVTAEQLQGETEAINIERTADNIVQVLPARVINSLPNTNIADAVGRAPSVTLERDEGEGKYIQIRGTEPRLSNVTVNGVTIPPPEGNVRNIKLDVIPASLVDRIEVNKTLSANQDADAIGGSVNLVTRTATDRPTIDFEGQGGYTPIQDGRWLDSFNGNIGQRFGAEKKLGVLFGGTYDWNGRGIDDVEPGPTNDVDAISGKNIAVVPTIDVREYRYYRTRWGFAGGLDYRLGPGSSAYLKGLFSDFHDFGDTWVYTYNAGTNPSQSGGITSYDNTGSMEFRHYIRRPDQQIFSASTGARHDLTSTLITYEFAISRSHQYGGFPTTYFRNGPSGVQFNVDTMDPYRPRYVVVGCGPIFDPTKYFMTQQEFIDDHASQLSLQGAASLARRYTAGSHQGTFELGFKVINSNKTRFSHNPFYDAPPSTLTLNQALGTFTNPNYYDRSYQLGPLTDYNQIVNLVTKNFSSFSFNSNKTHLQNDANNYDGTERIVAGYLMNSINFGKSRLQAGVRFEGTDESYTANRVNLNAATGKWESTVPNPGGGSYINVMPSVQWQYLLTQSTNLRATYGMGISRPNFSDLVPSIKFNPNNSPPSVVLGNPGLKATHANNFDVLVEHFFQPLGILQAGFFYKDLTDPIYNTTQKGAGQYAGFQVQQSINGPSAHITGFEASWEQRLSFLPGLLRGLGVAANYSYTTSQVSFPAFFSSTVFGGEGRTDHPALLRQAPNTWNLGATYDKARFSMRFGVSHNDANIYAYNFVHDPTTPNSDSDPILGLKGPNGDIYLYAHTQFDIQGSYRMYRGLQLVISGLNLSNEVFGFYQGSPIYPVQREFYKPSIIFGMRWSSSVE